MSDGRGWPEIVALAGIVLPLLYTGGVAAMAPDAGGGDLSAPVVVGVQGPGSNGQVIAYNADGTERWQYGNAASYHDVTVLENGHVLAAYAEGSESCEQYPAPCGRTGYRIIDPEPKPHLVEQWSMPVRSYGNSEIHDVEVLPNGDLVIVDMDRERVFRLDRETWEIEWQWNASAYYDAPPDPTRTDWLHMNDVDRIGPGRYLVSVRNANQLVVITPGEGVVEVINQDGDPWTLRGQHNPDQIRAGRVVVGDSSNDRVVELVKQGDEWTPIWSVGRAAGQAFAWPRDADRLPNGHTLVTDSRNHRLVEVTENGRVVGSIRTAKLPYEADAVGVDRTGALPTAEGEVAGGGGEGHLPVVGKVYLALQHTVGLPFWVTHAVVASWCLGLLAQLVPPAHEVSLVLRRRWIDAA